MITFLASRLRDDKGFTLVEIIVGSALALIVLGMVGSFLISMMRSSVFAEGQSQTINDVRTVMYQIEKETRGGDSISWCAPTGFCLQVDAQTPTAGTRTVRYKCTDCTSGGTQARTLTREVYNTGSSSWGTPQTVIDRLTNSSTQPVFACDTQSTLLRVNVDFYIEPTPHSNPNLHVIDSFRPRNFPSVATCP